MGSIQFCSIVGSAYLPPLSPNLESPAPPTITDSVSHMLVPETVTIAAGKTWKLSQYSV